MTSFAHETPLCAKLTHEAKKRREKTQSIDYEPLKRERDAKKRRARVYAAPFVFVLKQRLFSRFMKLKSSKAKSSISIIDR
jgi:hypothetical protein